jgi:hypothetical protein
MATERWIKIMLCNDGDARANTVEDGVLWVTGEKWAKIRNDKRIKVVQQKPIVLNGVYTVVPDASE